MICHTAILANEPSCAYSQWLTPNQIASIYSLAPNTVRNLCDRGLLPTTRLPSGHRKVRAEDAANYFSKLVVQGKNVTAEDGEEAGEVLFYGRVSSVGQKADLIRQVERLREYAKDKLGCSNPTEYKDIGSGLSENRDGYNRMVEAILNGKHNGATLLIENVDRLSRFNRSLFMTLCRHHKIEVIITAGDEVQKDSAEEWTRDLILICQVYGNRMSGRRSAERTRVVLTPSQTNLALSMIQGGAAYRDVVSHFKDELSENGKPITLAVIRRLAKTSGAFAVLSGDDNKPTNSFQRFELETIRATKGPTLVKKKRIVELYLAWCEANGETPIADSNLTAYYRRKGIETNYNRQGEVVYVGLSLITNKRRSAL